MKRIAFFFIWILGLSFLLASAWAQTNTNVTAVIAVPVVTQIETWANTIQNVLTGVLSVLTVLLALLAKFKSDKASVVPVLIRAIEDHGTPALKASISNAARDSGVSDTLHASVQAETKNDTPFKPPQTEPFDYRATLPPAHTSGYVSVDSTSVTSSTPPTPEIKPI